MVAKPAQQTLFACWGKAKVDNEKESESWLDIVGEYPIVSDLWTCTSATSLVCWVMALTMTKALCARYRKVVANDKKHNCTPTAMESRVAQCSASSCVELVLILVHQSTLAIVGAKQGVATLNRGGVVQIPECSWKATSKMLQNVSQSRLMKRCLQVIGTYSQ